MLLQSLRAHCKAPVSKEKLRPGGLAPSEWTQSINAIRDILVAAYSVPSANIMRRVAYHPPIVVTPFLLALLGSNFK